MKGKERSALSEVLEISVPAAGEMTAYTLMSIFDTLMIGKYGGNLSLSAVGLSNEITTSIINIFITYGISIGITSLTARCTGARENDLAEEYATIGIALGIFMAVFMSGFTFIKCEEIFKLAGARNMILIKGVNYIKIFSMAMFFSMSVNLINAVIRGYGNTYIPFIASIIITFTKICFDAFLIFGIAAPELGIEGSAIASVLAELLGTLYLTIYMVRFSKIKFRLRYLFNLSIERCRELIKLAAPSTLEEAAYSISRLLGTFIIMYSGTTGFAANEIANTVESISIMPAVGFGAAATTLVGIKVGEKNIKKAKEYTFSCTYWAVLISILFAIVFLVFPRPLIGTFVSINEVETLKLGAVCLAFGALEQPTIAISYVMAGALKGAGNTKGPFYISLFTSLAIRLPLIFYFIYVLKRSVVNVWWITAIQWGVDAILMYLSLSHMFKKYGRKYFFRI